PGTIYYFHNDRLGTPVRLTNEVGDTVWRADYRPFGDLERLETDVDGDGVHVEQPLRFPGQYEDSLSGLILAQGPYYNWNRHYEPATGRYFSSEPMLQIPKFVGAASEGGLGILSYAYALNSPVEYADSDGLLPWQFHCVGSPGDRRRQLNLPGLTKCEDCDALHRRATQNDCYTGLFNKGCVCKELLAAVGQACGDCRSLPRSLPQRTQSVACR
ncbi:MAG: RHS repeat-associated core domain-containing protein, partial [Rhodoglobus sp.]